MEILIPAQEAPPVYERKAAGRKYVSWFAKNHHRFVTA
jgi:hypothetical protein